MGQTCVWQVLNEHRLRRKKSPHAAERERVDVQVARRTQVEQVCTRPARTVGSRHGRPVVFVVAAGQMQQEGHAFYQADNGVWVTDEVPAHHLQLLSVV